MTLQKHEIRIFDDNIEDIDFEWGADLAGITFRKSEQCLPKGHTSWQKNSGIRV
jgi:hypothetical protein